MQHLIKNGDVVENDPWIPFEATEGDGLPSHALLPVTFWETSGSELKDSSLKFGAYVKENESIEVLLPHLSHIKVIAFEFAKFADGRAFSFARQLRSTHKFEGEIRAYGDFMPDQVNFLERVGFDAFALRNEAEMKTALDIKDHFSVQYQSDATIDTPLFRRR